jgi:hypothetical protein
MLDDAMKEEKDAKLGTFGDAVKGKQDAKLGDTVDGDTGDEVGRWISSASSHRTHC